jgi:hypothetical protein
MAVAAVGLVSCASILLEKVAGVSTVEVLDAVKGGAERCVGAVGFTVSDTVAVVVS